MIKKEEGNLNDQLKEKYLYIIYVMYDCIRKLLIVGYDV